MLVHKSCWFLIFWTIYRMNNQNTWLIKWGDMYTIKQNPSIDRAGRIQFLVQKTRLKLQSQIGLLLTLWRESFQRLVHNRRWLLRVSSFQLLWMPCLGFRVNLWLRRRDIWYATTEDLSETTERRKENYLCQFRTIKLLLPVIVICHITNSGTFLYTLDHVTM